MAQGSEEPESTESLAATVVDPTERERVDCSFEVIETLSGRPAPFTRYRLKGEVAHGGMGSILRVWDEDLRRHLAMKVIREAEPGDDEASTSKSLGRFLEEAQVTGQLDHPGIVPVHELGLDPQGRLYFTMKLVRGETLRDVYRHVAKGEAGWTLPRALGVLLKICEAMAYAHDKGVVHRDLKPSNVMVGRFGEVYVMDWGLARVLGRRDAKDVRVRRPEQPLHSRVETYRRRGAGDLDSPLVTMDGDVVGTPAYMSPEQARGEVEAIDGRTDVFAVGAMLYHLLTGHMPYVPESANLGNYAVWARVQEGPPRAVREEAPDAPEELVAICEKAMAREREERYASMLELAEDLRAFIEGRVVQAFETGALAQFKKWVRRNRALATTVLVAVLVAFGIVSAAALRLSAKNAALAMANALAVEKARIAEERGVALQAAQERFLQVAGLADAARLAELEAQAEELWPPYPSVVPEIEAWLAQARTFDSKLAEHRANLADLRAKAGVAIETAADDEDEALTPRGSFATPEDRWQHDHLVGLVGEIEAFVDRERGPLADVERRLATALGIAERSISGPNAVWRWSEAIESIADPNDCPAYGGLVLAPQLGLFPVGRDPRTGLWEFAHLLTGEAPTRDEKGNLVIEETSGVVLVLIPGGRARVGAQKLDPTAERFDRGAFEDESPVHEVELDAHFLSKYEMTQAQWLRASGSNPSIYGPDSSQKITLENPVENVSWFDCTRVLGRVGLVLPTEAQWEYGARAGTETPWWTGAEVESLSGAADLSDATFRDSGAPADWEVDGWLLDKFRFHAPVGSFRPNAFGLHDVHGNVWEWVRDEYGSYTVPARAGDGLREPRGARSYPIRGAGWANVSSFARSSRRYNTLGKAASNDLGVRPARAIDP